MSALESSKISHSEIDESRVMLTSEMVEMDAWMKTKMKHAMHIIMTTNWKLQCKLYGHYDEIYDENVEEN